MLEWPHFLTDKAGDLPPPLSSPPIRGNHCLDDDGNDSDDEEDDDDNDGNKSSKCTVCWPLFQALCIY